MSPKPSFAGSESKHSNSVKLTLKARPAAPHRRRTGLSLGGVGPMGEPNKAVFLSYASQDAEAARRICEALRAAGIEVWLVRMNLILMVLFSKS